jgi:hypothetical protein
MVFDKVLSQVHESYKQKIARSRPEGRASSSSTPSSSSKLKSISSSSSSSGSGSAVRQLQFDYLAPSTSIAPSPRKGGQSPVVRSGLKAQSFVQGTVSYCSVARVLALAAPKGAVSFADLGCGEGSCVSAALLFKSPIGDVRFTSVLGVELLKGTIDICRQVVSRLQPTAWVLGGCAQLKLMEADFLHEDVVAEWITADVVYACATCYGEDLMTRLLDKFTFLKEGTRVILIDRWIQDKDFLDLKTCCQVTTSWGTGCAYIYDKV